jgi:hypothetical protein
MIEKTPVRITNDELNSPEKLREIARRVYEQQVPVEFDIKPEPPLERPRIPANLPDFLKPYIV